MKDTMQREKKICMPKELWYKMEGSQSVSIRSRYARMGPVSRIDPSLNSYLSSLLMAPLRLPHELGRTVEENLQVEPTHIQRRFERQY